MKLPNLAALAACGAALLAGCGSGTTTFNVTVIHKNCVGGGSTDYFAGSLAPAVATVRITGPEMEPVEEDVKIGSGGELPLIPFGKDRVIEVSLFKDEAKKIPLGYGRSGPVEATKERTPDVTVVVNPIFDSVRMANEKSSCAVLKTGRAGFSIAKLDDGRVLVAGGYTETGPDEPGGLTDSAEVIDPRTGAITAAAKMCAEGDMGCSGRAYGPAVTLPGGDVLIAGGLVLGQDEKPDSSHALVYDPAANSWKSVLMNQARRFNTATTLSKGAGKVLVVGGVGDRASGGQILDTTEIYDPRTNTFSPGVNTDKPVARHSAIQFTSRDVVGIAGGITTNQIGQAAISGLVMAFEPVSGDRATASVLGTPVAGATVVRLGDLMLIAGGATSWASLAGELADGGPVPSAVFSGWQTWGGSGNVSTHDASSGSTFGCGATIGKTRSWIGGGLNAANSPFEEMKFGTVNPTPELVDVNKPGAESVAQTLEDRRADFGCIALNENQILIVGGWGNQRGGANRALDTIEVLTVGATLGAGN